MAWARIDDKFFNHPKVRAAGKDAVIFYIAALCHCNTFTTDGFISDDMISLVGAQSFQTRPKQCAERLVTCGLWHRVENGYTVNDFLKYNYTREQIVDLKEKRSASGKQGGRPPKLNNNLNESKTEAKEKQNESKTEANLKQSESHTHINTHINTNTHIKSIEKKEAVALVFKAYEREIGVITPIISGEILAMIDDGFPAEWFEAAFQESAMHNKRNWKYAAAILRRWKIEGFQRNSKSREQPKFEIGHTVKDGVITKVWIGADGVEHFTDPTKAVSNV